ATSVIAAAAIAMIVGASRALAGRTHAVAALVVVVGWLAAFGNVAIDPWVRTVVVLPLLAYFVLAALFASGNSVVAAPAAFFGALAAETHVSTVPMVGAVGVAAVAAFVIGARRRGGLVVRERRHLVIAGVLLAFTFLPPIVDELAPSRTGNFGKIAHFF